MRSPRVHMINYLSKLLENLDSAFLKPGEHEKKNPIQKKSFFLYEKKVWNFEIIISFINHNGEFSKKLLFFLKNLGFSEISNFQYFFSIWFFFESFFFVFSGFQKARIWGLKQFGAKYVQFRSARTQMSGYRTNISILLLPFRKRTFKSAFR